MSAPGFDQKTNQNPINFQVEQTLPSKEELKRQIKQLIKEDYQGAKGFSFGIIIAIAIWVIILCATWLAWFWLPDIVDWNFRSVLMFLSQFLYDVTYAKCIYLLENQNIFEPKKLRYLQRLSKKVQFKGHYFVKSINFLSSTSPKTIFCKYSITVHFFIWQCLVVLLAID